MKKSLATAGIAGGILTSVEPVAAAEHTVTIEGNGTYELDFSHSPGVYGELNGGQVEETFDGLITEIRMFGDLTVDADSTDEGGNARITVEGDGDYGFTIANEHGADIHKESNCESSDSISGQDVTGSLNGYDNLDKYDTTAAISYATTWENPDAKVEIYYNI
ncbi:MULTISPECIES: hypothetical protein [Haloferax]|uniref:Uncharacterized protein n=1 Tax=Haloferax mediterranei (strain ATCC 33500 / DSM 1411 / JCM 8866 / NBRC 14739 / NCIMB 2177 / R-4) TaxID=523841 RepID=I3RB96_HALMT|nr:hypothetical protein [Haloferax mediterranei]AFK21506.1 hypothetical protein HFX_6386 [Haloferax mediterranei ATCC 33500]